MYDPNDLSHGKAHRRYVSRPFEHRAKSEPADSAPDGPQKPLAREVVVAPTAKDRARPRKKKAHAAIKEAPQGHTLTAPGSAVELVPEGKIIQPQATGPINRPPISTEREANDFIDYNPRASDVQKQHQPFALRVGELEDVPFVYDSWAASYREFGGAMVDDDVYKVEQRARISRILDRAKLITAMGTRQEILGWVVYQKDRATGWPVIHYMYVKGYARRGGIGRAMMTQAGWVAGTFCWVTHWQPCVRELRNPSKFGWTYNPYLLERK